MPDTELNIDFETASKVDLKACGAYRYAMDPSTEILMMYWAFDDEDPEEWLPGEPFPQRIVSHVISKGRINAANAAFERLIWWYVMTPKYGTVAGGTPIPEPKLEQFYCTLYKARCNNMPSKLELLAKALGTFNQKYAKRGWELIRLFCLKYPDGSVNADDLSDEDWEKEFNDFCDYCAQDVRTERACANALREPTEEEWQDYFVSERINDRGIRIDRELAKGAIQYAAEEEAELVAAIGELTDGAVEKARGEKLKTWVMERLTEEQKRLMVRHKDGEKKYSLDKSVREHLLAEELDPLVAEVLKCSDMAQKSSVGKFKAMINRADPQTDRVCGVFMANGAAASGRYSSMGLQKHNFPRDCMPDVDAKDGIRDDIVQGILAEDIVDYYDMPMMTVLSRLLRPAIIAGKENRLVVIDWSAIEGRVCPWLTKTRAGDKKLQLYRDGVDTYKHAAGPIYNVEYDDVTKDQRQVGKVAELSLQYQGGANAFMSMARNYGVQVTRGEAEEIKTAWRHLNPWVAGKDGLGMWSRCEKAAFMAIENPGMMVPVGHVTYFSVPDILGYNLTLFCQLPCGRVLTYPDVRVGQKKTPWGEMRPSISAMRAGWSPKVGEKDWPRSGLYGGLLVENITQGTAASILRWALRECDYEGLPTVSHVHDEIILETSESEADDAYALLDEIMTDGPEWAEGLPLAAEGGILTRYGK